MKAIARVRSTSGKYAAVEADPATSCSSCALKSSCTLKESSNEKEVLESIFSVRSLIVVENPKGAKPGDIVEFEFDEREILKGASVVYGVPSVFAIVGIVLGTLFEKLLRIRIANIENLTTVVFTISSVLVGVLAVKMIDSRRARFFKITDILSETD